jgi:hypothetical protein
MSDISTTLSMNSPLFTSGELLTCSVFNVKMFLLVLMILVCISIILSSLNSLFGGDLETPPPQQGGCAFEQFSNDEFYSYKDAINPNYSHYQSSSLTSKTNNLIFGQANRFVYANDNSKPIYRVEIFANLYILNGNPFGVTKLNIENAPFKHKYVAYLKQTKNGKRVELGQVKLDGDGMYKLKFESDTPNEFMPFNELEIVHKTDEKETQVLRGKFTIL